MSKSYDVRWDEIKKILAEIGFDVFGITGSEPFEALFSRLENYYLEGRSTGFEHPMAKTRWDPKELFPPVKSMIAVAIPYRTSAGETMIRPKGRSGIVSRYAWGDDYHLILKSMLGKVSEELSLLTDRHVQSLVCVDTSPLVDRAIAERAGIGWIGKNAMLITDKYGSYVFLGTLLTDLQIEPQPTSVPYDECKDCTLCMTACPTQAIIAPYQIDGQQCLSGVTQIKGIIAEPVRKKLGRRIWGCDTCQTVCPKNVGSLYSYVEGFEPSPDLSYPDLKELIRIKKRVFQEKYGHTAVAWRGHHVLRRNAIIALANAGDITAIPDLQELLTDPRPEIRASAAWSLQILAPEESRHSVQAAYELETVEDVKKEMIWSLKNPD